MSKAVIQSGQFLCQTVPARAANRIKWLGTNVPKDLPGIDRLLDRYDSFISCPFPGYAHGQLAEMDVEKSTALGIWLENGLQSLDQDISHLSEQIRTRQDRPAFLELLMSSTYLHMITLRLLASQHNGFVKSLAQPVRTVASPKLCLHISR